MTNNNVFIHRCQSELKEQGRALVEFSIVINVVIWFGMP